MVDLDANEPVSTDVDIALYDSFAQPESDHDEVTVLARNGHGRQVAVYRWSFHFDLF